MNAAAGKCFGIGLMGLAVGSMAFEPRLRFAISNDIGFCRMQCDLDAERS